MSRSGRSRGRDGLIVAIVALLMVGMASSAEASSFGSANRGFARACVRVVAQGNSVHGDETAGWVTVWEGCDGEQITGLTMEELWNLRCHGENYGFGGYQEGYTVEFDFKPVSEPKLERIIEIREAAENADVGREDHQGSWDWEDHNRYYPTGGLDVTEVYTSVTVWCDRGDTDDGQLSRWGIVLLRPVTDFVDPTAARARAEARLKLPPPEVASSPPHNDPGRHGVVHVPTWMWVENPWTAVGPETDTDVPAIVTVMALPSHVRWEMGEKTGEEGWKDCFGPGVPWVRGMSDDETYCSYTYTTSSAGSGDDAAFDLKATANYTFVWWVNGTYLGAYADGSSTADFTYQVGEIQAVES